MKYEGVNFRNFWSICPGMPPIETINLAMSEATYTSADFVCLPNEVHSSGWYRYVGMSFFGDGFHKALLWNETPIS